MDFSSKESSIPLTLSLLLLSRLIFGGDGIHVIRYRHRLNILALSGKVFLDRYKTSLTAKPVSLRPDQAIPQFLQCQWTWEAQWRRDSAMAHRLCGDIGAGSSPTFVYLCCWLSLLPVQEEQQTTAGNCLKGTYWSFFGCHHPSDVLKELLGLSQITSLQWIPRAGWLYSQPLQLRHRRKLWMCCESHSDKNL